MRRGNEEVPLDVLRQAVRVEATNAGARVESTPTGSAIVYPSQINPPEEHRLRLSEDSTLLEKRDPSGEWRAIGEPFTYAEAWSSVAGARAAVGRRVLLGIFAWLLCGVALLIGIFYPAPRTLGLIALGAALVAALVLWPKRVPEEEPWAWAFLALSFPSVACLIRSAIPPVEWLGVLVFGGLSVGAVAMVPANGAIHTVIGALRLLDRDPRRLLERSQPPETLLP